MNKNAFDAGVASARAGAAGTDATVNKNRNLAPAVGGGDRNTNRRQYGRTTVAVGGEKNIPALTRRG